MDRQSESCELNYFSARPKRGGAALGAFGTFEHKIIIYKNYVSYYNTVQYVTLPNAKIEQACSSYIMLFSSFSTNHIVKICPHTLIAQCRNCMQIPQRQVRVLLSLSP
jgi:hypothetical protein